MRRRRPARLAFRAGTPTNPYEEREKELRPTASVMRPDDRWPGRLHSFTPRAKNPCFARNKHASCLVTPGENADREHRLACRLRVRPWGFFSVLYENPNILVHVLYGLGGRPEVPRADARDQLLGEFGRAEQWSVGAATSTAAAAAPLLGNPALESDRGS
eukprot:COSAG03_NODE_1118_length_4781_cov_2.790474_3_plen_160_part_00